MVHASVTVNERTIAEINRGLLVLVGVEKEDTQKQARRLLDRLLGYRVFPDKDGKMNLCLVDTGGDLLLVPQFTLVADTDKGMRASFSRGAPPEQGRMLFEYLCTQAKASGIHTATGQFGADMQVTLTNDGPVTFWLQS